VDAPIRLGILRSEGIDVGAGSLRLEVARGICEAGLRVETAGDACEAGRAIPGLRPLLNTDAPFVDVCKDDLLLVVTEGRFAAVEGFASSGPFLSGGLLGLSNSFCGTSRAAGCREIPET
jgi:hypothetical protein